MRVHLPLDQLKAARVTAGDGTASELFFNFSVGVLSNLFWWVIFHKLYKYSITSLEMLTQDVNEV